MQNTSDFTFLPSGTETVVKAEAEEQTTRNIALTLIGAPALARARLVQESVRDGVERC